MEKSQTTAKLISIPTEFTTSPLLSSTSHISKSEHQSRQDINQPNVVEANTPESLETKQSNQNKSQYSVYPQSMNVDKTATRIYQPPKSITFEQHSFWWIIIGIIIVITLIITLYFVYKRYSEGFSSVIPQKQYYRKLYHQPYYSNDMYYW